MARVILPEDGWLPAGRGRGIDFFATDEELAGVVSTCLPAEYAPYAAIGMDKVKEGKIYVDNPIVVAVDDMLRLRKGGTWDLYILSRGISPDLVVTKGKLLFRVLSFNGLVNIQFGTLVHAPKGEFWSRSGIGMMDRVVNIHSNEVVVHNEYRRVLECLRKGIRRVLRYPTVETFLDGRQFRRKDMLMSEAYAEKCRRGDIIPEAMPDFGDDA